MNAVVAQKVESNLLLVIKKQNNMHTKPPQTHIVFIMPRPASDTQPISSIVIATTKVLMQCVSPLLL